MQLRKNPGRHEECRASDGSTEFHEAIVQPVALLSPSLPVTLKILLAQHTDRETGQWSQKR
jgi:hypothetical protein